MHIELTHVIDLRYAASLKDEGEAGWSLWGGACGRCGQVRPSSLSKMGGKVKYIMDFDGIPKYQIYSFEY